MWPNPNLSTNRFIIIWPTIQTRCVHVSVCSREIFFSGVFFSAQCNKTNRCKICALLYALACNHQMMMRNARGRITYFSVCILHVNERTNALNQYMEMTRNKKKTLTHSHTFWSIWKQSRFDLISTQHRQWMLAFTRFTEESWFVQCQTHKTLRTLKRQMKNESNRLYWYTIAQSISRSILSINIRISRGKERGRGIALILF